MIPLWFHSVLNWFFVFVLDTIYPCLQFLRSVLFLSIHHIALIDRGQASGEQHALKVGPNSFQHVLSQYHTIRYAGSYVCKCFPIYESNLFIYLSFIKETLVVIVVTRTVRTVQQCDILYCTVNLQYIITVITSVHQYINTLSHFEAIVEWPSYVQANYHN